MLVSLYSKIDHRWQSAAIAFGIILVTGYAWISFCNEKFIYRKLKLVLSLFTRPKRPKRRDLLQICAAAPSGSKTCRGSWKPGRKKTNRRSNYSSANEQFRKEFLQNLSHEFKTPVFAIQGYVDTLLHGALENPDVNRKFLEKAATNIERLTNLLNDLDEISLKLERASSTSSNNR